jgi:hypothetical protein
VQSLNFQLEQLLLLWCQTADPFLLVEFGCWRLGRRVDRLGRSAEEGRDASVDLWLLLVNSIGYGICLSFEHDAEVVAEAHTDNSGKVDLAK